MSALTLIYWVLEMTGLCAGVLLNLLLLLVILKTLNRRTRNYSAILLTSCLFELSFSLVELFTQHVSFVVLKCFL